MYANYTFLNNDILTLLKAIRDFQCLQGSQGLGS